MSSYITINELENEINQLNKEIFPTNLHITEFQTIKNSFNYKWGSIFFEIKYSETFNGFTLIQKDKFQKDEYYITINEPKDLKESLIAIVLNLIEKSTTNIAKRNLIYSKASEYEEILTILDKLTEKSAIQEYWVLLITPWLMNSDKSIQERVNIEVTKFEIVTGASEFLKEQIQKELLVKCGRIKKEVEAKINAHELLENATRSISPFLKIGLNTVFYFGVKKDSLEPEFANFFYNMLLNNKVNSIQDFVEYIEENLESLYISAIKEYFYQLLIQNYSYYTNKDIDKLVDRCKSELKFSITITNAPYTFKLGLSDNFNRFIVSEQDNYDILLECNYNKSKGYIEPKFSHKIMNNYFSLEDANEIKEVYKHMNKTLTRLKNAL